MDYSFPDQSKILFYKSDNGHSGPMDEYLINAGYLPLHTNSDAEALRLARYERPTAVFIYLDGSGETGLKMCEKIKSESLGKGSTLFLVSSKENESEIVRAFKYGADYFLPRLHGPHELLARLEAVERRKIGNGTYRVNVKDITIDLYEQQVYKNGSPIRLTYIQYKMLCLFACNPNKVYSREDILDKIWGKNSVLLARTVDVHIKRLREKLGEDKYPSQYIQTVHGSGYRISRQ